MQPRALALSVIAVASMGMIGLAGPVRTTSAQKPPNRNNLDLDYKDADIREVLKDLFKRVGITYVLAPEVQGKVTLSVKNVPFDLVLESLLRQSNARLRIEGMVYQIVLKRFEVRSDATDYSRISLTSEPVAIADDETYLYIVRGRAVTKIVKSNLPVGKTLIE